MSFGRLRDYRSAEQLGRMDDRDRAALLDELLAGRNPEAFSAICDLLSLWPSGPERSRQLARARRGLESWDDGVRAASSASESLYEGDRLSDVASLVRSISVYRREDRGGMELLAIAGSEYASELASLSIVASELSGVAWRALVTSRHLGGLRRLVLQSTTLGRGGVGELLQSPSLPGLQTLELVGLGLGAQELAPLKNGLPFPELRSLDLSHNVLGAEGAQVLAGVPGLARVRWLAVRDNAVRRVGIEALIQSSFARQRATLDVRNNGLSAEDKRVLRASAERKGLELVV